jgi:hypothetical protein
VIGRSMTSPPNACVIAQQHSSTTFVLFRFHSRMENFGANFKTVISNLFTSLKLRNLKFP